MKICLVFLLLGSNYLLNYMASFFALSIAEKRFFFPDEMILKHLQNEGHQVLFLQLQKDRHCSLKVSGRKSCSITKELQEFNQETYFLPLRLCSSNFLPQKNPSVDNICVWLLPVDLNENLHICLRAVTGEMALSVL